MLVLKDNINHSAFLHAVMRCKGDILFATQEGDILNLKSALSQFVFAASFLRPEIVKNAAIRCADPSDLDGIKEYLMEIEV